MSRRTTKQRRAARRRSSWCLRRREVRLAQWREIVSGWFEPLAMAWLARITIWDRRHQP